MAGSKKSRSLQTRISFSPLPSSSPAAKDYHQQVKDRAAAVRYESATPSPAKRRRVQFSSPDHEAEGSTTYLPTPDSPVAATSSQRRTRKKARQQRLDLASFTTPAATVAAEQTASTPKDATPQDSSDEADDLPVRSAKKRRTGGAGFMSSTNRVRTRGQTQLQLEPPTNASSIAATTSTGMQIDSGSSDDDDDDDDMPTTIGSRKRGSQRTQRTSSPAFEAPSDDDELQVVQVRKRQAEQSEDSDDDDRLPTTPRRRMLKRPKVISQQDRNDLAEDLEFLEPDSDADTPRQPRDSKTLRKAARMTALEALKRKRSGQPVEPEPEPAEEEEPSIGVPDEQYISSDPDDNPAPTSSRSMFQADEEDEEFLVEDDEALGVPEDLPLEFSKYASMKGRDLFQYAVEWMVQKKINPAFNITDGLYDLTFKKLNDEVSGLVSSKFSSSAWTADFVTSLRARPSIAVETHEAFDSEFMPNHCDACNRTNHPATMTIQFQGKPYHLETLDNVEAPDDLDEDDSDSSSDQDGVNEKTSYDAQGRELPPASKLYHVGRFCGANAETAHELAHWKLNLYHWVVDWIVDNGYNTPAQVVERDKWSTKKRRKYANKICDRMAEQGVTRKLWKEFQETINRARESKQGRY